MKKSDYFIRRDYVLKEKNLDYISKEESGLKQTSTKSETSDKENQEAKENKFFKAIKSSLKPINKDAYNEEIDFDNHIDNKEIPSFIPKNDQALYKFKKPDFQSSTIITNKNEWFDENKEKKSAKEEKTKKPIRVMKKTSYEKFEYYKPYNRIRSTDGLDDMVPINDLAKEESLRVLNISNSESFVKRPKDDEEEILRYMCAPLNTQKIEDIKYKWQQFFISSSRVIPDINRAINNKPDPVYYEYIRDLIDDFTDKQMLFAIKNILLNEDLIKPLEMMFIFRDLFYRLKTHGTFDLSSKVNIILLYEIFFLFDLIEYKIKIDDSSINLVNGNIMQMIFMIIDYQRFFFPEFKIEENLMILKAMMDKNVIDVYLIKKFLTQYSEIDIVNTLKDCTYKIKYFNTEFNLNLSIFYILDNYVKVCKNNNECQSLQLNFLVRRLITEVLFLISKYFFFYLIF
jgi:hypothetical protein